jgi:hypothetical protein
MHVVWDLVPLWVIALNQNFEGREQVESRLKMAQFTEACHDF